MKALMLMALIVACALAPACASTGTNAGALAQQDTTTVMVDNQAVLDMTIYVLRGSQRIRLGIATGLSKTRFTIPQGIVFGATSLRFFADPIGGSRSPVSEEITISPGEEIGLMIPPN